MFRTTDYAARRAGMLVAGLVLTAADLLLVGHAIAMGFEQVQPTDNVLYRLTHLMAGTGRPFHTILTAMWPLSILAGLLTYAVVSTSRGLQSRPVRATTAFVVPAAAAAFALPLTVHMIAYAVEGASPSSFEEWVPFALGVTALAHLTLVIMVGKRAAQLVREPDPLVPVISVKRIYWTTVAMSLFPGALILMIPPIIVAVTGFAIVPVLMAMEWYAKREHGIVTVPVARARVLA